MLSPERAANLAWVLWALSWGAAAVWRKPAANRAGAAAELPHLAITVIGLLLVFATPAAMRWGLSQVGLAQPERLRLWPSNDLLGWTLFGLEVAGFAFCWWARLHLGALWSGSVTRKEGHRIVETGPYALVRHPIYTGLITSVLAIALLHATAPALLGVALVVLGFWLKARLEERFLRAELGPADYDAYAARTPMLAPKLPPPGRRS